MGTRDRGADHGCRSREGSTDPVVSGAANDRRSEEVFARCDRRGTEGFEVTMHEHATRLRQRLRRAPSASSVSRTIPVLCFGDLLSADVATVGLNPSDREYVDRMGALLTGASQRFETLDSLGAADRS